MKSAEGRLGRVFILRFEEDDEITECLEKFAKENGVSVGYVNFIGGVGSGEIIAGPQNPDARPISGLSVPVNSAHETAAIGLIAPDEDGNPKIHFHGTLGREKSTISGCMRKGLKTWLTGEAVMYEILGTSCQRIKDEDAGISLLSPKAEASEAVVEKEAPVPVSQPATEEEEHVGEHSHILHIFNAEFN